MKLYAVAGYVRYDTNIIRQTRELDTGFLGYSLRGSGQDPVVLEGLRVQLALDANGDEDKDGLKNFDELQLGTDPFNRDTDGDGLLDGWEVANHLNPLSVAGNDGAAAEADGDAIANAWEQGLGTHRHDAT